MEDLKDIIAENLTHLRTQAGLTQLQLAEMLNYSDKAVSKWERGEAVPDVRTLVQLASIYNISLDDIVRADAARKKVRPKLSIAKKRLLVTLLSVALVWFVATAAFTLFYFIAATEQYAYMAFVVAPFAMSVVMLVFSILWGNELSTALACSLVLWTAALIFHIFVITFTDFKKIYLLYVAAAVFEVLIILWFVFRKITHKSRLAQKSSGKKKK